MGFEKEKMKQIYKLIAFTALLVLAVIYFKEIVMEIKYIMSILNPFFIGCGIAFVLNILVCSIEGKLLKSWKGKLANSFKRPLSIVLSLVIVFMLISFVIVIVVPQIINTIADLGKTVPIFVKETIERIDVAAKDYPQLQEYIDELQDIKLDWNTVVSNIGEFLKSGVTDVMSSTVSIASNIIGGLLNCLIGFIFSLYILGQKEKLANQGKRILKAYLKPEKNSKVLRLCTLLYRNFSNFITGQCLEALCFGSIIIIAMTILRLPYAILVGVMFSFLTLIPIVGSLIGCVITAFLMLADDPKKAAIFLIMYVILQQLDGNLIYPRIVGNKVGLPSIWVLFAVTVGGSLFGILGMIAFIPLVSTFYALLRENVNNRNDEKNIKVKKNKI